ncbi:MAG: lysylphosphatidylglycerol synthase transmembrane domain-containing protein [Candidatus Woesearchaeota archaeon]
MDKKKLIVVTAFILGVIVFLEVLRRVGFAKIVNIFSSANKTWLSLFLIISIGITFTLIARWQVILRSKHVTLPFWKVSLFKLVGFSFSYLTPTGQVGGESIRGVLLNREKVANSTAFSSVMIDKGIELATHISFACIGFIFIILNYQLTQNTLLVLTSALLAAVVLLGLFYYRITRNKGFISSAYYIFRLDRIVKLKKYEQHLRDIEVDISNFFKFNRRALKIALLLSLLSWVFMFMEYETALLTFGYSPSILALFLVICVVGFAYIIPVPAALGILELSQASLFTILNVDVGIGIALGLLIRLRDVLWAITGLVYLSGYRYFSERTMDQIVIYRINYAKRKMLLFCHNLTGNTRNTTKRLFRTCKYKGLVLYKRLVR